MRRRTFLQGAAAGLGLSALGRSAHADLLNIALPSLGIETRPSKTPVEHLVVLMMENRSVDHLLGWYGAENPKFDAHQHAQFPDLRQGPDGPMLETQDWGELGRRNYHGRANADPNHSWNGGRAERRGGALDGWLDPATHNDEFSLSYYNAVDVPVWAQLTRDYQTYDRWFAALLGSTYPNRYYLHSGQTGGIKDNTFFVSMPDRPEWSLGFDWPTVWTLCESFGVTCGYYFSNLPVTALWGGRHLLHCRPMAEFYADAALGRLPQVTFLDPWFVVPNGLANDDHPHADIRLGQALISDVVEAFATSPQYRCGALAITYDEWGGFWDHVQPPHVRDDRGTAGDPGGPDDFGQLGFRVPSTIVSPWTKRPGSVDHTVYEHSSITRFISDNWNLPQLTARTRGAASIERAFGGFTTYDPEPAWVPYEAPLHLYVEPTGELVQQAVDQQLGQLGVPTSVASSDLYGLAERGALDGLGLPLDQRFEDSYLRKRPELIADVERSFGLR
jgi:phospholipase C